MSGHSSLSADLGREVHEIQEQLASMVGRVRGIQRTVPENSDLWVDLAALRTDFCCVLATANGAVAMLGALRMTGQAPPLEQLELHPRHHQPFADGKCAAANDHTV